MRENREVFGLDVDGRVLIAVVMRPAAVARPLGLVDSEGKVNLATHMTQLARGELAVHRNERAPIPLGLVLELAKKLRHRRVEQRAVEARLRLHARAGMGLRATRRRRHRLHPERFHADHLVLMNNACGHAVQSLTPTIGDTGMEARNAAPGHGTSVRPFALTCKTLLKALELAGVARKASRIVEGGAVIERRETACAGVDTAAEPNRLRGGARGLFDAERDPVAPPIIGGSTMLTTHRSQARLHDEPDEQKNLQGGAQ